MKKKHGWIGKWTFRHIGRDGELLDEWDQFNALADEGEEYMLGAGLRQLSQATNFYLGLYNDTPAETDGLSDLTGEASGNGYSRQTIEANATGWPTLAKDSGDYMASSKTVTFTASGGSIGPVTYAVLATSSDNTGKLVAYVALSQSRTLADGESLQCSMTVKLSEAA